MSAPTSSRTKGRTTSTSSVAAQHFKTILLGFVIMVLVCGFFVFTTSSSESSRRLLEPSKVHVATLTSSKGSSAAEVDTITPPPLPSLPSSSPQTEVPVDHDTSSSQLGGATPTPMANEVVDSTAAPPPGAAVTDAAQQQQQPLTTTFSRDFQWRTFDREVVVNSSSKYCRSETLMPKAVTARSSASTTSCEWHIESKRFDVPSSFVGVRDADKTLLTQKALIFGSPSATGSDISSSSSQQHQQQPVADLSVFQHFVNAKGCFNDQQKVPSASGGTSHQQQQQSPTQLKTLLVIGHSHSRYMAGMICMMLNASNCNEFSEQYRNVTIIPREEGSSGEGKDVLLPPYIIFLQGNYDFRRKLAVLVEQIQQEVLLPGLLKQWRKLNPNGGSGSRQLPSAQLPFVSHVLVSRGVWDVMFQDASNFMAVAEQLESGVEVLMNLVSPTASIILHMPHYVHNRVAQHRKASRRAVAIWRAHCFSEKRVYRIRDMNLCAAARFSNLHSKAKKSPPQQPIISHQQQSLYLYDSWHQTKTGTGSEFADGLGHHYLDIMLEALSMQFLDAFVCPSESSAKAAEMLGTRIPLHKDGSGPIFGEDRSSGDGGDGAVGNGSSAVKADTVAFNWNGACDRVASENYPLERSCMCHNESMVKDIHECSVFGKFIPPLSRR